METIKTDYNKLIKSINKFKIFYGERIGHWVILYIFSVSFLSFVILLISESWPEIINFNLTSFLWLFSTLFAWLIFILWLNVINKWYKLKNEIDTFYDWSLEKIDPIEDIIKKTSRVQEQVEKLYTLQWIARIFFIHQETKAICLEIIGFMNLILKDARSDLITNISKQKFDLEKAIEDVKNNLIGTPELVKVSELQQARLDSQIAEFEKLQKILVKV